MLDIADLSPPSLLVLLLDSPVGPTNLGIVNAFLAMCLVGRKLIFLHCEMFRLFCPAKAEDSDDR